MSQVLPEREREIFRLRSQDYSLTEIGSRMNLTQRRVQQLLAESDWKIVQMRAGSPNTPSHFYCFERFGDSVAQAYQLQQANASVARPFRKAAFG